MWGNISVGMGGPYGIPASSFAGLFTVVLQQVSLLGTHVFDTPELT
jgi:hypothetical protein